MQHLVLCYFRMVSTIANDSRCKAARQSIDRGEDVRRFEKLLQAHSSSSESDGLHVQAWPHAVASYPNALSRLSQPVSHSSPH